VFRRFEALVDSDKREKKPHRADEDDEIGGKEKKDEFGRVLQFVSRDQGVDSEEKKE